MVKKGEKNLKINYLKEKCINNCNKKLKKKNLYNTDTQRKLINTKNSILPSNIITHITKDDYNRIWIGTEDDLIVYNKKGVSQLNLQQITSSYFTIKNNSEIECFLPNSRNVEIKIYNNQGKLIETILEENMLKGKHLFLLQYR